MKSIYKSDLARLAGMGVSPRAQMLPPRAVKFVVEDYYIELPEKF